MKKIGKLLKTKTVIGGIVAVFSPMVMQYVGIDAAGLAELVQAVGAILAIIGGRDAIDKLGK